MWISRKDYEALERELREARKTRDAAESKLDDFKRKLMPTRHYQVIDTNSGLRYDVNAVDYFFDYDHYEGRYCVNFRKADYSVVLSIHKDVSIQVMGEE